MEEDLKYLLIGYRKYTNTTQRDLANKLDIPIYTYTALELGSFKQPSEHLITQIKEITADYDQEGLKQIGRGYRIKDKLGPDFKYFIRGLKSEKGLNPDDLKNMPHDECLKTIGSVDMDEFDLVDIGRTIYK